MTTMKKLVSILLILLPLFTVCQLRAQSIAITAPYYCGFEDPAENALWKLNVGTGTSCNDQWYIGTAVFNEGLHSLYISDKGGVDARYGAKPNVNVVTRQFTIPDGAYEVSFDWRNLATNNSGLYVCIYSPQAYTAESDPNSAAVPAWVQNTWKQVSLSTGSYTTCMRNNFDWNTSAFTFNVAGGRTLELAFAWVNSNRDTTVLNPLSACIDNIQITSTNCRKPWDLQVKASCDSVLLDWQGVSEQYLMEYKINGTSTWRVVSNIPSDTRKNRQQYVLTNLPEGVYDFRVKGMCVAEGDTSYSAYATCNSKLVYCPDLHCINYVDLANNSNITCYTGSVNGGGFIPNYVDYGPLESMSRHTVNNNRFQYDPRTHNKLLTVPTSEYASIRLGNWRAGGEAERIDFNITVDAASYGILLLKYAIVLEDPTSHGEKQKPYFRLTILDEFGQLLDGDACGDIFFYADMTRPGWNSDGSSGLGGDGLCWKDWTTIGVNLQEHDGEDITIRLETGDCTMSGHYGYAYFALNCTSGTIQNVGCGATPQMDMKAPEGFDYEWTSSDDRNLILSTKQVYTVDASDTRTYYCTCYLIENHDCYFELSTVVSPREAYADYSTEWKPERCQNKVALTNLSHVTSLDDDGNLIHTTEKCETTTWDFGGGDVRVENNPVYVFPAEGGTVNFTMKAEIANGACSDVKTGTITAPSIATDPEVIYDTICPGDSYPFADKLLFRSETLVDSSKNVAGCDSITTLHLYVRPKIEDTIIDTTICFGDVFQVGNNKYTTSQTKKTIRISSSNGCDSIIVLTLKVLDKVTATITTTPEVDEPNSGSITIADAPDGYTYSINGVMGGSLTGLTGGTYRIVIYNDHGCPSDTIEAFVDRECLAVNVKLDTSAPIVACADDGFIPLSFSLDEGFLSGYSIEFDPKATAAGFENVSGEITEEGLVRLQLPSVVRPDFYDALLIFRDPICEDVSFPITLEIDYPSSIVRQKWNNVLAVLNADSNGGYSFSRFEWYRNNGMLVGENGSYLYLGEDAVFNTADTYHAVLTRDDDGVSMPTCPINLGVKIDVTQYPVLNMAMAGTAMRIKCELGASPTVCRLYTTSGALLSTTSAIGDELVVDMPQQAGVYLLVIDNRTELTHKKIVVR